MTTEQHIALFIGFGLLGLLWFISAIDYICDEPICPHWLTKLMALQLPLVFFITMIITCFVYVFLK